MDGLRQNPPKAFGDLKVVSVRDYQSGKVVNLETGEESNTNLPKSNVLYFDLTEDSWCCARPSGTEPKIKFYFGVKAPLASTEEFERVQDELDAKIEAIKAELKLV